MKILGRGGAAGGRARMIVPFVIALGAGWTSGSSRAWAQPPDSADGERILRKEVIVNATADDVWRAWTTSEGIASFFCPRSEIDLRVGGAYELLLGKPDERGKQGTQGCRVLSLIPNAMLAFEWSFPPKIPALRNSDAKTQVVLRFDQLADGRVKVRFAQLGWQQGADWDAGYAYFDQAWSRVFEQLKKRFESGARSDSAATVKDEETKTWTDGHVTVTASYGPEKRQDFELAFPVPVQTVWSALATTEGSREFVAPQAEIELKPGGRYAIWPEAPNRVLAYVPLEMLSTSGSAPPEFPNVRKGGTWSAYFFEPQGEHATRVRLAVVGWQEGPEWDRAFEYFLKNDALFLNHLRAKLSETVSDHER